MVNLAKVKIWNTFVGAVAWNENSDQVIFEFDEEFVNKNWDLAPVVMPLGTLHSGKRIYSFPNLNVNTYKGLPGLLADSLPDKFGTILLESWFAEQGRSMNSINPVERLCFTGKRGMGALEYEPAFKKIDDKSKVIEVEKLIEITKKILNSRTKLKTNIHKKTTSGVLDIIRVGTSAGGARAKAVIAYNEKTGDVRSGQLDNLPEFEYWIIKFDGVSQSDLGEPKNYGKIEYAYYLMTVDSGINMTKCKLLEENDRFHFMTMRFDRKGNKKLHMQTLCAIAHYDYNDPNSYSYEMAFQIMRQMRLPYTDAEELFRRMVFNIIARNHDDHTKNISFLMEDTGRWRLSPAYDITYAFDPANKWIKSHQLSVNGKRDGITRTDLLEVAKKMNIKKPKEIIEKIIDVIGSWSEYAKEAGLNIGQIKSIQKTLVRTI